MTGANSVVVHNLWHSFGKQPAVLRGVNLVVPHGGITALLGLNGAGKTTLLRSLLGLVRPTSGSIEILGISVEPQRLTPQLLARVGYVPEHALAAEGTTPRDMLALLRDVHPGYDADTVRKYLSVFAIPLDTKCKHLSAGTKAQLALTLAMAGRPELLILDEPTQGLDPVHRHQYLRLLLEEVTERELSILLTTHDLYQIERMADQIAILHNGCIAVQAALDDLKEQTKRIRVGAAGSDPELAATLAKIPGVTHVQPDLGGFLLAATSAPQQVADTIRTLPGVNGIQLLDLSLEEIFFVYCGE